GVYNDFIWNSLVDKLPTYKKFKGTYQQQAVEILTTAAPSTSKIVARIFQQDNQLDQTRLDELNELDELDERDSGILDDTSISKLYKFGIKKFQGNLEEDDYAQIVCQKTKGDSIYQHITNNVTYLLCKQMLSSAEQENLK
ncbi:hypothetical protein DFQ28_007308, partial [Apophysomyces sp. BC1034]